RRHTSLPLEHRWELQLHIDQCVITAKSTKCHEKYHESLTASPPSLSRRSPPPPQRLYLQPGQKMVEYNSDVGHDTGGAMVGETQGSVRWGIECRFEFIEFRLFWKGHVNRGDLMPVSGISINQASADLNPTPAWHRRPCS